MAILVMGVMATVIRLTTLDGPTTGTVTVGLGSRVRHGDGAVGVGVGVGIVEVIMVAIVEAMAGDVVGEMAGSIPGAVVDFMAVSHSVAAVRAGFMVAGPQAASMAVEAAGMVVAVATGKSQIFSAMSFREKALLGAFSFSSS